MLLEFRGVVVHATHTLYSRRERNVNKPLTWSAAVIQSLITMPSTVRPAARLMSSHGGRICAVWLRFCFARNTISFVFPQFRRRLLFFVQQLRATRTYAKSNVRMVDTWSASISVVFIVNLRLQNVNKSSRDGPSKSMTSTL